MEEEKNASLAKELIYWRTISDTEVKTTESKSEVSDNANIKRPDFKEKICFFCAGSVVYTNVLVLVGCYPVLSKAYNEYLYGFYSFFFGNLCVFTSPFLFSLIRKLPFNHQTNICTTICTFSILIQVLMPI